MSNKLLGLYSYEFYWKVFDRKNNELSINDNAPNLKIIYTL